MKTIPLTQGFVALVDDDDFVWLSPSKWYVMKTAKSGLCYAARGTPTVWMHREIMNASLGMEVDHIDGNGLNNQKSNLRLCTRSENTRNRKLNSSNTSGYKGVAWHKATGKWIAYIKCDNQQYYLGIFDSIEEAAMARELAEKEMFGEFRRATCQAREIQAA